MLWGVYSTACTPTAPKTLSAMDNFVSSACNYLSVQDVHYFTSVLSYVVFTNFNPQYPNCKDCPYYVSLSTLFSETNFSSADIAPDIYIPDFALNSSVSVLHLVQNLQDEPFTFTFNLIGDEGSWAIWTRLNASKIPHYLALNETIMKVIDPLNITWCSIFRFHKLPETDLTNASAEGHCRETPSSLDVKNYKSAVTLDTVSVASGSHNVTFYALLKSSNITGYCYATFFYSDVVTGARKSIQCVVVPLLLKVTLSQVTNETDRLTATAVFDIEWLAEALEQVSLEVGYYTFNTSQAQCKSFNQFNYSTVPFGASTTKDTIDVTPNPNKSLVIQWTPKTAFRLQNKEVAFAALYENNKDKACIWEKRADNNVSNTDKANCPNSVISWPPTGEIIFITEKFNSPYPQLTFVIIYSNGTEEVGVRVREVIQPVTTASTPTSSIQPSSTSVPDLTSNFSTTASGTTTVESRQHSSLGAPFHTTATLDPVAPDLPQDSTEWPVNSSAALTVPTTVSPDLLATKSANAQSSTNAENSTVGQLFTTDATLSTQTTSLDTSKPAPMPVTLASTALQPEDSSKDPLNLIETTSATETAHIRQHTFATTSSDAPVSMGPVVHTLLGAFATHAPSNHSPTGANKTPHAPALQTTASFKQTQTVATSTQSKRHTSTSHGTSLLPPGTFVYYCSE